MKVAFIVFATVIASAFGNRAKIPGLGKPCQLSDKLCCTNKFKVIGALFLPALLEVVIPELKSEIDYGCCNLNFVAKNTRFAGISRAELESFTIDLSGGTIELILKAAQVNVSTSYNIAGKCVNYISVGLAGDAVLALGAPRVVLSINFGVKKGLLKLIGVSLLPTLKGISIELSNPAMAKLQNDLNRIPLSEMFVIFQNIFRVLIIKLELILLEILVKLIDGLALALLFILTA